MSYLKALIKYEVIIAASGPDDGVEPGKDLGVPKAQMPSVRDISVPNRCKLWSWFSVVLTNVALIPLSVVRIISLTFEEGVETYLN